jgi:very-short-patch-repair endonuclease
VHFARLADEDLGRREDIPVTSWARTMLDLAGSLSGNRLERTIERSEELGRFDLGALDTLLGRAGNHPGAGRLRRALAIYRDEPAVLRSRLEKRFLRQVLVAGLSRPATNFHIAGFELDAYWAAERFAVELDVFATHGSRAAFERDRLRQEELKLAGIEMIRVTGPRFDREPEVVLARLAELLARRRCPGRLN